MASMRHREKLESDFEATLCYLDRLSAKDLNLYVEYQVDKDNRLSNLFWANEKARRDYVTFREVLAYI